MFRKSKPMSICPLPYNFRVVKSTFCYQLMVFAQWQMLSLLTSLELIWFHKLIFLVGLRQQLRRKQRIILSRLIPNKHVSPFSCGGLQMFILASDMERRALEALLFQFCAHFIGGRGVSARLGTFQELLPFPYLICFLQQEGVQELDVSFVVRPSRWFFCLLGCGSFHFVPFVYPFCWVLF